MHRKKEKLKDITADEFFHIFYSDDFGLQKVMKMIGEIDKDHNGYVTQTEIDDILKIVYPKKI